MIGIAVHRFDQPFYGLFCDCVAQCARQRGYGLVVSVCGDDFEETIAETYQLNADGWIFFADAITLRCVCHLKQDYPVILAGGYLGDGELDAVMMPNVDASCYAANWLIEHSDGRIGMTGASFEIYEKDAIDLDPTPQWLRHIQDRDTDMRLHGYLLALQDHALQLDWTIIRPVRKLIEIEGEKAQVPTTAYRL